MYIVLKNNIGVWLSLVERYVRDVEAAGSNPVTPINKKPVLWAFSFCLQNYGKISAFLPRIIPHIPVCMMI